jgi:hypothetical protein
MGHVRSKCIDEVVKTGGGLFDTGYLLTIVGYMRSHAVTLSRALAGYLRCLNLSLSS